MSGALASVREKAKSGLNKAKSAVGIKNPEDNTAIDEISEMCPQLTYQQRIYGFAACFTIGWLISSMSFQFFKDLVDGNPVPFVIIYSLGNIISLLSSMFQAFVRLCAGTCTFTMHQPSPGLEHAFLKCSRP